LKSETRCPICDVGIENNAQKTADFVEFWRLLAGAQDARAEANLFNELSQSSRMGNGS